MIFMLSVSKQNPASSNPIKSSLFQDIAIAWKFILDWQMEGEKNK